MEWLNELLLVSALVLAVGIAASGPASRLGMPALLAFLLVGMAFGEDGPGGIHFDDYRLSFAVGNLALALILLDGGLRTQRATFRVGLRPALVLASAGVALTAVALGLACAWLLDIDWRLGLLLGAIVSSTDAAAVFSMLRAGGVRLNDRIGATLEIESGVNDPMAVFLTMTLIGVALAAGLPDPGAAAEAAASGVAGSAVTGAGVTGAGVTSAGVTGAGIADSASAADMLIPSRGSGSGQLQGPSGTGPLALALFFVQQFGVGALLGALSGWAAAAGARWWRVGEGLTAIFLSALGVTVFAVTNLAGGSGFLAVFLFGFVLSDRAGQRVTPALGAMDGIAWLSQSGMFLLLGLLVTPSRMASVLLPALAIALLLIVAARPLAVWLCLLPFRFRRAEVAFIAWTGLRGAVPIVLAIFPLLAQVPQALLLFDVAFVVVLVSLLLQGTTLGRAARLLGVALPERAPPLALHALAAGPELAEFAVAANAPVEGVPATLVELPAGCRLAGAWRGGEPLDAHLHPLRLGDVVAVSGPQGVPGRLAVAFRARPPRPAGQRRAAALPLDAQAGFGEVAAVYGLPVTAALAAMPLGEALETMSRRLLVEGDRVRVGTAVFVVMEMRGGRPGRVGLEL